MKTRPFFAARIEDRVNRFLNRILLRMGWQESVITFTGIGTEDQIRILARLVLRPPRTLGLVQAAAELLVRRGWRNFINVAQIDGSATIVLPGRRVKVKADRGGYIDVRIDDPGLEAGWHNVQIDGGRGASAVAPVQVVSKDVKIGIVSDIDDTIISTWIPRPLLAAWNSFILTEQARQAVPGMARLYQHVLADHPGAPIVYVSTGAWNTYPMVRRFQARHGFPFGPVLLTDWGPTNTGWFRKGADHKRNCLRELARDLPHVKWLLVGDDGQHDPSLYGEFAHLQPDHVLAIAIRQLSVGEHALVHGSLSESQTDQEWPAGAAREVRAPDGDGLAEQLREIIPAGTGEREGL